MRYGMQAKGFGTSIAVWARGGWWWWTTTWDFAIADCRQGKQRGWPHNIESNDHWSIIVIIRGLLIPFICIGCLELR